MSLTNCTEGRFLLWVSLLLAGAGGCVPDRSPEEPADSTIPVSEVILSETSLSMEEETSALLKVEVLPADATDRFVTWSTDHPEILMVDGGYLKALRAGEAVVNAVAGEKKATCTVTVRVPDAAVDMGLSVLWARCNLGAERPGDPGKYFSWGETVPKEQYTAFTYRHWMSVEGNHHYTKYYDGHYGDEYWMGNGELDRKKRLDPGDDAAFVLLGEGWRMPTGEEMQELRDAMNDGSRYSRYWTSSDGHPGLKVTRIETGASIFLPAAGIHSCLPLEETSSLVDVDHVGRYWTSDLYYTSPQFASTLQFGIDKDGQLRLPLVLDGTSRYFGLPIRPVKAK